MFVVRISGEQCKGKNCFICEILYVFLKLSDVSIVTFQPGISYI